jgi:hypothetical protein
MACSNFYIDCVASTKKRKRKKTGLSVGVKKSKKNSSKNKKSSGICIPVKPRVHFMDFVQKERTIAHQKDVKTLKHSATLLRNSDVAGCQSLSMRKEHFRLTNQIAINGTDNLERFDRDVQRFLSYKKDARIRSEDSVYSNLTEEFKSWTGQTREHQNPSEVNTLKCPDCDFPMCRQSSSTKVICNNCGMVKKFIDCGVNNLQFGTDIEYSAFSYKRVNHLIEFLNRFQSREMTPVPQEIIFQVMDILYETGWRCNKKISYNIVRDAVRKLGITKYYDLSMQIFVKITGQKPIRLDPSFEEKVRHMFIQMQVPFKRHCPKDRKNFMSYPVVLFKISQILGYDHLLPYFSLLKCKEKLQIQEDLFEKICIDLGWKFIPIPKKYL